MGVSKLSLAVLICALSFASTQGQRAPQGVHIFFDPVAHVQRMAQLFSDIALARADAISSAGEAAVSATQSSVDISNQFIESVGLRDVQVAMFEAFQGFQGTPMQAEKIAREVWESQGYDLGDVDLDDMLESAEEDEAPSKPKQGNNNNNNNKQIGATASLTRMERLRKEQKERREKREKQAARQQRKRAQDDSEDEDEDEKENASAKKSSSNGPNKKASGGNNKNNDRGNKSNDRNEQKRGNNGNKKSANGVMLGRRMFM